MASKWGNDPIMKDFWRAWRGCKKRAYRGRTGNEQIQRARAKHRGEGAKTLISRIIQAPSRYGKTMRRIIETPR